MDPQEPPKDQWLPLICPSCNQSAYDINSTCAFTSETITPEMLRLTDPAALEPKLGNVLDCPYCSGPLGRPVIYPKVGGGWVIMFRWFAQVGNTH